MWPLPKVALPLGTRLGPYEVIALLGAGGMGEVYRARDTKLNRDVALKVLPDVFAGDSDRLGRFRREAQVLASLNHPNIAAIHGFEDSGSTHALVLELVEGPTLADRIATGMIPLDEALPIAKQIADALEAAHDQGIVHRDLKPANIKLRPDGTVKVLDFGLAKALEPASATMGVSVTASPTLTSPAMMTGMGMILGTAAYMSPEQAKGRPADKRSDIWAFGCVLYEMLTGARAFEAEDIAETLAYVLTKDPDWSKLPPQLPLPIGAVLRRCLVKDRRRRVADIAAVQFVLDDAAVLSTTAQAAPVNTPRTLRWRSAAAIAALLVAAVAATGLVAWEYQRRNTRAPVVTRFSITPPALEPLLVQSPGTGTNIILDRAIAITPDGTRLIYRGGTNPKPQLMVRALDQLEAHALSGITDVREPVSSPDGRWIAFYQAGELRKVSITGGPSIGICRVGGNPAGLSWGDNDVIVYAIGSAGSTTVYTVPAGGGEPKVLLAPDTAHGEAGFRFPSVLPDARAVLLTLSQVGGLRQSDNAEIVLVDLQTKQRKVLVRGGAAAQYVDSGHLIYAASGSLRAVPFDIRRLEVVGDPVPVVEGVSTSATAEANFAVSRTGTLVYVPASPDTTAFTAQYSLTWVDRRGREEPLSAPLRTYTYPRISPDGTRVALDIRDQENDIWIWELKRQTLTRLTFDPGVDRAPIWTPDGKRLIFTSQRGGGSAGGNVFWQAADGTGTAERLTTSPDAQFPMSISPDGKRLVIRHDRTGTKMDLDVVTLDGKPQVTPLIQTMFNEQNGQISPDGHWIAYESDENGQFEIYVRPFPEVDGGGRWQISPAGGTRPLWEKKNGHELFYLDPSRALMAVPVQTSPAFNAGNPAKLFDTRYETPNNGVTYDVSPDGQRFLMIKGKQASGPASAPSMVVVLNWTEELKQRVPTR